MNHFEVKKKKQPFFFFFGDRISYSVALAVLDFACKPGWPPIHRGHSVMTVPHGTRLPLAFQLASLVPAQ